MQVEIYDERELNPETLTREPDAEALALIAELGLAAQTTESGARLAYPTPTADQALVLNVLFPAATKLSEYAAGGIPLRVLKEIRSYREENPDHVLVVRHAPPAVICDPVLLAYTDGKHPWMAVNSQVSNWREFRLVARWGDALDSWAKLTEKASVVAAQRAAVALRAVIRQAQSLIAGIESGDGWPSSEVPELSNLPNPRRPF